MLDGNQPSWVKPLATGAEVRGARDAKRLERNACRIMHGRCLALLAKGSSSTRQLGGLSVAIGLGRLRWLLA